VRYNKEEGFTLIEFMIVIALIGMGLLFVVSQFKDAGDQNKSQTAIKNITGVASGVSSFKDLRNGFLGMNETAFAASSAAPSNMVIAGVLTNIFGSPVTIVGTATNYTVTYPGVPTKNCVDIASKLVPSFKTVSVGGTAITNLVTANTECSKSATVSIDFTGN